MSVNPEAPNRNASKMHHEWILRAHDQFEARSGGYQGGLAQRLFCRPTSTILLHNLPIQRDLCVLDVGCGTGQLIVDIARHLPDARLVGLDLSAGMVNAARSHCNVAGVAATIQQGVSNQLPYDDACFDLVVCTHSFHHYPDQDRVISEFVRVLAPGGWAMILDGDPRPIWGYLLFSVIIPWFEGEVHHCSKAEMKASFTRNGLSNIRQFRRYFWSPVLLTIGQRPQRPMDR
jgi:ubiquinone/menaquinone biosynthesis C-methylase UbiE